MFGSEIIKTMIRPLLVFVVLMVGVTALLQKTLIVYKLAGSYSHWAVILLALPIVIGLLLRIMETEQPLLIIILGAFASTLGLYFLYKNYFWAQAPTLMNGLFLFAVTAGGAHLPYSRTPVERLLDRILTIFTQQKKTARKRSNTNIRTKPTRARTEPSVLKAIFTHENTIPMIEMSVGVISLLLSVYSIAFMGKG